MSNGVKIDIRKETDKRLIQIRRGMVAACPEIWPDLWQIPYNAVIVWLLDHQEL